MEEWVGQVWHKLITRSAPQEYPDAAIFLQDVQRSVALLFRALGGEGGMRVEAATESLHGARRNMLSRIAGNNQHIELAWRDNETLYLPKRIACFENAALNRELYLWLAALAALSPACTGVANSNGLEQWVSTNEHNTTSLLQQYPGLAKRYKKLLAAHLAQRPDPAEVSTLEAQQEMAIRQALGGAGGQRLSIDVRAKHRPAPVPLWLHPEPPVSAPVLLPQSEESDEDEDEEQENNAEEIETEKRSRGERVDEPEGKGGLLAFRLESLFTRTEYVAVDRTEDENADDAKSSIEDLDVLSMSRTRNKIAAKLRFDLDLPSEEHDDVKLGEGIPLPEWDYRSAQLLADHCRLQPMQARDISDTELPAHLRSKARRLRSVFEALKPRRIWHPGQIDGCEIDTNALIRQATDRLRGQRSTDASLYRSFRNTERDLSCLVLADLSLSTDAHVDNAQRVIDVIRDSLHLFSEALMGTGDRFALYGFSSRHRSHVRYHTIKTFDESHSGVVRGRINAIKPGYYTRMGAAIRYSTQLLAKEPSTQKLLLILTDGKPNDLDKYEGRYGVEDTRVAVREAVREGIQPFCVTIDKKAGDYLPYLFGSSSFVLMRNARELPAKLPALYARLTR